MKTLLVGSGGREHALAWKLLQSPKLTSLFCAPGNAGLAEICDCRNISAGDVGGLVDLVTSEGIEFVVIGPEQPLSLGLTDALHAIGVAVFGPTQAAAQLETSKAFMKAFCAKYNIPTAGYQLFTDITKAKAFLRTMKPPFVIKTDGLAAGKGVAIPESLQEADAELEAYFSGKFGAAGQRVVIEEFMPGEEISFFALCDGASAIAFGSAQDHKRVFDGDNGPNTGGMGAYAPAPIFTKDLQDQVMETIIKPTVAGMAAEGHPFTGVLFAGLMITDAGPRLIEYNIRFGDPECQVIMRQLNSDVLESLYAAATGTLNTASQPQWDQGPVVNVVLCAQGYPGRYTKGTRLTLSSDIKQREGVEVFHAGTLREDGYLRANGGRVLNVTARADDLKTAVSRAYAAIDHSIDWDDGFCRRDIAWRAL